MSGSGTEWKEPSFDEDSLKFAKVKPNDAGQFFLEMTMVADKSMIAFHGDDTADYLLKLAHMVNSNLVLCLFVISYFTSARKRAISESICKFQ